MSSSSPSNRDESRDDNRDRNRDTKEIASERTESPAGASVSGAATPNPAEERPNPPPTPPSSSFADDAFLSRCETSEINNYSQSQNASSSFVVLGESSQPLPDDSQNLSEVSRIRLLSANSYLFGSLSNACVHPELTCWDESHES